MAEFARRFEGQVSCNVLTTMRDIFKLGAVEEDDPNKALIRHAGWWCWTWKRRMEMLMPSMFDSLPLA
jgi:hypothetical protein